MQIMFFRQHFGSLAIGLSNVNGGRDRRLSEMKTRYHDWEREMFFSVTDGGVSHPWSHKTDEVRVAITGDGMVFIPEGDQPDTEIFAKVEFQMTGEVYLAYKRPYSVISYGLPDPVELAEDAVKTAMNHVNCVQNPKESLWVAVTKKQVAHHHRSLLGKVMRRVQGAVNQGGDFFKNPQAT